MDLSTLSSLLETHTRTISALYTSLGAPEETVSIKLEELHTALISTVDSQRTSAEREVKEVQERVDNLRASCEQRRKRLGESRTSSANGTETLLQARQRLEKEETSTSIVLQEREKQFQGVRKRLDGYVEILGHETVFVDKNDKEEEDLSLVRLNTLEKEVTRCRNEQVSTLLYCYGLRCWLTH